MLKVKPDYPATFHMDGLLSVPVGIRSAYTGVKFEHPPTAVSAPAGAAAQPSPAAAQQEDTQDVTQKDSPNKTRAVFTEDQLFELEKAFSENKYLTRDEIQLLASHTKMAYHQVRIWLQNRRQRWKQTVSKAAIANEREKMRSRGKLRKAESLVGPIVMNRIITAAGLEFEELSEGQLCPVVILACVSR